jgi:hypothetical protein
MSFAAELAALYRRDLTRLIQELDAFPDDVALWKTLPGVSNSAGNLTLHLEGNLREFIGRQLGDVAFTRRRDAEFSGRDFPQADLIHCIEEVRELVSDIVATLSEASLRATYPQQVHGAAISTQQLIFSLYGHLSYHLGQIDYLRRICTGGTPNGGSAINFVSL